MSSAPAPEQHHFEPDLQKKLEKIARLGWSRMRWADGFSLLHWACKKNRLDLVRHLLEKASFKSEIDVDLQDDRSKTAVEYAKSEAIKEYISYFKANGGIANSGGNNNNVNNADGVGIGGGGSMAVAGGIQNQQNQQNQQNSGPPLGLDPDAYKDINLLLASFVDAVLVSDERVPFAAEELMDRFAIMLSDRNPEHEKVGILVREASKEEPAVVKNAIQHTASMVNVLVPDHAPYHPEVHNETVTEYSHKHKSVSVDNHKSQSTVIERLVEVNRSDRDLGLIIGLSGTHIIGFANKRLVHDFELGDQIVGINGYPVGCTMELCRAVYMACDSAQGGPVQIRFAVKRGSEELTRRLVEDGYLSYETRNYFVTRRDMSILASAALKCGLVSLPGGEEATYILGHVCSDTQESRNLLNGIVGNVREIKIEIEFLPGRPKSLGLELALGSTKIRRFALNAANCRYLGKHYFVQNDLVVSVGGIKVSTEAELKDAYSQSRDHHDVICFIVKREIGNVQPEFEFGPGSQQQLQLAQSMRAAGALSSNQGPTAMPSGGGPISSNNNGTTSNSNDIDPVSGKRYIDYGPNPYNIKTVLTVDEVKANLPQEYRRALQKVERRGWAATKWDRGYTLLHWSARSGDLELCKFLIAAVGADPNMRDDRGLLPKDHAKKKGWDQVVGLLENVCNS